MLLKLINLFLPIATFFVINLFFLIFQHRLQLKIGLLLICFLIIQHCLQLEIGLLTNLTKPIHYS